MALITNTANQTYLEMTEKKRAKVELDYHRLKKDIAKSDITNAFN